MTEKLHLRISKCIADYSLNLEAATVCVCDSLNGLWNDQYAGHVND